VLRWTATNSFHRTVPLAAVRIGRTLAEVGSIEKISWGAPPPKIRIAI
jgi:hypothetical protein